MSCRKVIATEVAKSGVASAHENLKANDVTNVFVARLSSEEFASAWKKERAFTRLQVQHSPRYVHIVLYWVEAWAGDVASDGVCKANSRLQTENKVSRAQVLQQVFRCLRDGPASEPA